MSTAKHDGVGAAVRKKDAMQLLTGKPVYLDDLPEPDGCLTVRLLRSPYANAVIRSVDAAEALRIPGVTAVYTWEDVPPERFTEAGQTYPETSPHDRLILDRHVRHVGDPAAIVAAENAEAAEKAIDAIRVDYEVLPPVLGIRNAKDNPVLVHPEEDWHSLCPFTGGDPKRNLCASGEEGEGDVEAVLRDCDLVIGHTYHVKAVNQVPFETFRTLTQTDAYGRLHVISSTQIVFHVRRILSHALGIPKSMIRVEKPRIGGGFGAKQTAVSEVYPAFVTMKTGRPAKLVYTRRESLEAGSPRHEMEITVRLGAMKDGTVRAIDLYSLSNTGAYGEHGWATVGLTAHKSIPLYTSSVEAFRFRYDVVYTNVQSSGAYRGFGATQGIFAVESAVNELASRLGLDPLEIRLKNCVREGQIMPAYYHEPASSCNLEECLRSCAEKFGWAEKYPVRVMPDGMIRSAGMAMAMQGSGISGIDVGSATVRLDDDGGYTLLVGAADMGTGCDTILAQILSDVMDCPLDRITVVGANTDVSPYDSGSYASSTTFVTGKAVELAGEKLKENLLRLAGRLLDAAPETLSFLGDRVASESAEVTLAALADASMNGNDIPTEVTASNSRPTSPPPFMVGMAEIELDPGTGSVRVLDYQAVVDCGTVVNPALARVQTEGGIVQGIGMTLLEDIRYDKNGKLAENSLMRYKIPTRLETGRLHVDFAPSYEKSGPFGAKSIGEIVINTPAPAITHAICRATGKWFRTLPITPERIVMEKEEE